MLGINLLFNKNLENIKILKRYYSIKGLFTVEKAFNGIYDNIKTYHLYSLLFFFSFESSEQFFESIVITLFLN